MTSSKCLARKRTRRPTITNSQIRHYLVGDTPTRDLTPDARALVNAAEDLDALPTTRGWEFEHELAGLGALSWHWPPSGSPTNDLYASPDPNAHDLEPVTSIGFYLNGLSMTAPHIIRAGDCTHSPDTQLPLHQIPDIPDCLEAHRYTPTEPHIC